MRTRMFHGLVPVAAAGAVLVGLIALGRLAHDRLRQHESYTISLADIDCPAPPGLERPEFLAEVQYLARLPDRLPALDEETPDRLAEAFARHPWVEKVEEVRILPPDQARVRLVFRTPALAVPLGKQLRVVDGQAVLLPRATTADGLLILRNTVAAPSGHAGSAWDDPAVHAAAAVAATLRPSLDSLGLTECEVKDGIVELRGGGARVLWGHAPGNETADEVSAEEKLRRLLDYCAVHGRLSAAEPPVHDVRAAAGP